MLLAECLLSRGREFLPRETDHAPRGQVPRLTRMFALAHAFEAMIRHGEVTDYADIVRLTGFTRARITTMMDLTLLAPDIQEQILMWSRVRGERDAPSEKKVARIASVPGWEEQRRRWRGVGHGAHASSPASNPHPLD